MGPTLNEGLQLGRIVLDGMRTLIESRLLVQLAVTQSYGWLLLIMATCGLVYTPYETLYKTTI